MVSTNPIEGTAYSCKSDALVLNLKKLELDFAKKNNKVTPFKLQQLQEDYDASKMKYDASPCGKDPETDDCIALQARITSMQSSIQYARSTGDNKHADLLTKSLETIVKEFDNKKCRDKVGGFRAGVVRSISETFQALDKARIEEESKYQAKQKIFFGAIVLVGAVLIITMFGKRQ
jgi:hypothetical protein